jgi:hypothetical protein
MKSFTNDKEAKEWLKQYLLKNETLS